MHTLTMFQPAAFTTTNGGQPSDLDAIFPDLSTLDRVAIVTTEAGQSFAAGLTLLACVAQYYALVSEQEDDFFLYPDYYVVHVGGLHGWHGHLDVWPQHKEVVVPSVAEDLVAALNDRGITRLLLPPGTARSATMMRATVRRLQDQLRTVLTYGVGDAGVVQIAGPPAATGLVEKAIRSSGLSDAARDASLLRAATGSEGLTPMPLDDAVSRLAGLAEDCAGVGMSDEYREAHRVTGDGLAHQLMRVEA